MPGRLNQNKEPVWLGAISTIPGREFQGMIDEVAIFQRALSWKEVVEMFRIGKPFGSFAAGTSQERR